MRPASLLHFYRIRLRARLVADLLALVGIAVGVGLVFAALVANTSLTGSVRELGEGLFGKATLQLAARDSAGFDQRLLGRVDRLDAARSVAPLLEARVNLVGSAGARSVLLVGADPRFARFGGRLLRHLRIREGARPGLALPAPLARDLGVEPGGRVEVESASGTVQARVRAQLSESQVGSLASSPVALAPLPLAQALTGLEGRLSRIFLSPRPSRAERLRRGLERVAAGRLEVAPADREVAVFEQAAYPTNQSTTLFSALSALVGFLFALSAMLLAVPQRRRLIAELRLAGYAPLTVTGILLVDALALGVAGSALGLALGDQACRRLFATAPEYLTSAFAVGSQQIVTWQSVAIAALAGFAAACLAVLAPLRNALRSDPARTKGAGASSGQLRWLVTAGLAFLALAVAIARFAPSLALLALVALTASLVLLLPGVSRGSAAAADLLARRVRNPSLIMASLELRSGAVRIRALALAATGAIAVFATVSIGAAGGDLQRGLDEVSEAVDRNEDVWVTLRGAGNLLGTAPFALTPRQLDAVRRVPQVRSVHRYGGAFLDVGEHRAWLLAPPATVDEPIPEGQIRAGAESLAEHRIRAGGWLVLSEGIAAQEGVAVGDRIVLPTPTPTPLRVAALSTNNGWPGGAIVMSSADFARAFATHALGALGVRMRSGASASAAASAVRRALGSRVPLRVEARGARLRRHRASSRAGLVRLAQISTLVLIAAILAMVVSAGGLIWQRRPAFAALKLDGFDERELWASLLVETGLLLGTGCLLGALFGLGGQALLDRALAAITGFPVSYAIAIPTALGLLVLVTGVAVAMLALPGRLAVKVRPSTGSSSG